MGQVDVLVEELKPVFPSLIVEHAENCGIHTISIQEGTTKIGCVSYTKELARPISEYLESFKKTLGETHGSRS